jgi:hypothetical protein
MTDREERPPSFENPFGELLEDLGRTGRGPARPPWGERRYREMEERREELLAAWRKRRTGMDPDRETEEGGRGTDPRQPLESEKERYVRWMEVMWERNQTNAREERRKQEVLGIFEDLGELSRRRLEAPRFPPWDPPPW